MEIPLRIAIAEDHTILREGLKALLSLAPDIEIVGEAGDGHAAVEMCREKLPELLLLDLSMPRLNGLEALRQIKRLSPETRVLVLTVHKTEEHVFEALKHGADGYTLKDAAADELLLAIRSVAKGHRYLCPSISTKVIDGYLGAREGKSDPTSYDRLSDREREVLKLVAEGHRNRDIADLLFLSIKTVEKHRSNLMRKLDLHNIQALTAYAIEKGLLSR